MVFGVSRVSFVVSMLPNSKQSSCEASTFKFKLTAVNYQPEAGVLALYCQPPLPVRNYAEGMPVVVQRQLMVSVLALARLAQVG